MNCIIVVDFYSFYNVEIGFIRYKIYYPFNDVDFIFLIESCM